MKTIKIFAFALAIMSSSVIFANSSPAPEKGSFSYELARYLDKGNFTFNQDHKGKVLFYLNQERRVVVHFIQFQDKEVKEYIMQNLQDKKLSNENWEIGKIYSLPLQIKL